MRPKQWLKSIFVMIGPLFAWADQSQAEALGGGGSITGTRQAWELLWPALLTAVGFSLVSSACYIVNDIVDAPRDRLHPRKRLRPIASGAVSPAAGVTLAAVVGLIGFAIPLLGVPGDGRWWTLLALGLYMGNVMLYSYVLKQAVIGDVMGLSLGFVLRVLGGCAAAMVAPSSWLLNVTFFLAMFLAFGKRLGERRTMGEEAASVRGVHAYYTDDLLRMSVVVTAVATLITYAGYVQAHEAAYLWSVLLGNGASAVGGTGAGGGGGGLNLLWLTMVPATYAMFRAIVLLERGRHDDPTELATKDRSFQAAAVLFAAMLVGLLVLRVHAGHG